MPRAANHACYALGKPGPNGFKVRKIVWGKIMASYERRHDEEIRQAIISVGKIKVRPVKVIDDQPSVVPFVTQRAINDARNRLSDANFAKYIERMKARGKREEIDAYLAKINMDQPSTSDSAKSSMSNISRE